MRITDYATSLPELWRSEMKILTCECGATAKDTSKERGRFKRRHPKLCYARHKLTKQLAATTRAVDADRPENRE